MTGNVSKVRQTVN